MQNNQPRIPRTLFILILQLTRFIIFEKDHQKVDLWQLQSNSKKQHSAFPSWTDKKWKGRGVSYSSVNSFGREGSMALSCKLFWTIQNVTNKKLRYNLMKTIICLAFICVLVVQGSQIERNLQIFDIGRRDGRDHGAPGFENRNHTEIQNHTKIQNHTEIGNHAEIRNHTDANERYTDNNAFPNTDQLKHVQQLPRRGHRQEGVGFKEDTLRNETEQASQDSETHTKRTESDQPDNQSPHSGSRKSHREEKGGKNNRKSESHFKETQTHAVENETHPVRNETHRVENETHPVRNETHQALPIAITCLLDADCTTAFPNARREIICDTISGICVLA